MGVAADPRGDDRRRERFFEHFNKGGGTLPRLVKSESAARLDAADAADDDDADDAAAAARVGGAAAGLRRARRSRTSRRATRRVGLPWPILTKCEFAARGDAAPRARHALDGRGERRRGGRLATRPAPPRRRAERRRARSRSSLPHMSFLAAVDVTGNRLDGGAVAALVAAMRAQCRRARGCDTPALPFARLCVVLDDNGVGDEGVDALVALFEAEDDARPPRLAELSLGRTAIGEVAKAGASPPAMKLFAALRAGRACACASRACASPQCRLGAAAFGALAAAVAGEALRDSLEALDVSWNDAHSASAIALVDAPAPTRESSLSLGIATACQRRGRRDQGVGRRRARAARACCAVRRAGRARPERQPLLGRGVRAPRRDGRRRQLASSRSPRSRRSSASVTDGPERRDRPISICRPSERRGRAPGAHHLSEHAGTACAVPLSSTGRHTGADLLEQLVRRVELGVVVARVQNRARLNPVICESARRTCRAMRAAALAGANRGRAHQVRARVGLLEARSPALPPSSTVVHHLLDSRRVRVHVAAQLGASAHSTARASASNSARSTSDRCACSTPTRCPLQYRAPVAVAREEVAARGALLSFVADLGGAHAGGAGHDRGRAVPTRTSFGARATAPSAIPAIAMAAGPRPTRARASCPS